MLASAATADARTFGASDSGKTVRVAKGATFVVKLKQASDGGYLWRYRVKPDPKVLRRVKHKTTSSCHAPYCVGGTTTIFWTFKAVGRGRTTVDLIEKRSFEKKPIKRFKLIVKVR